MKSKNLLKKSISTLLCISTLMFSVGMISHGNEKIDSETYLIKTLGTDGKWGNFNSLTTEALNKAINSGSPYAICSPFGDNCNVYNIPAKPEGWLSKISNIALAPFALINYVGTSLGAFFGNVPNLLMGALLTVSLYNSFIKDFFNSFFNKNCGDIEEVTDPIEAIEKFDKYLEPIKAQVKPKHELRRFALNTIDEKNQRIRGLSNRKGAYIIYLVGPSGVGKSMSAEALTKVLTGSDSKPYIVEPSDIDGSSTKATVVDQLFGMRTKKVQMSEMYEKSPLVKQVQATPNMVLLINEYDKMCNKDLDEKLRTIADHGYINVNGEMVDFSKVTIIITSNEDLGSMKKTEHKDDGTGSRTQIEHDKAFLNRLNIIEFENLTAKDYVEIEKPRFSDLQQRYVSDYNVFVTFEDGLLEKVAKLVEQKNEGARPIQRFIDNINDKLLTDVILKGSKDRSYMGKSINVSLNEDGENSSFVLSESNDYSKILQIFITRLKNIYLNNYNMKLEISDDTVNNLVEFINKNDASTSLASSLINSLNKEMIDKVISKDKKGKSYMGKTYNATFDGSKWSVSESNN